jgi:hypothetical protein
MKKRGQIWVETVIYTLIGLAIIGIVLAASKPKIEEMKDKLIIEQTISSLNDLSSQIYDAQMAPGNKRIIDMQISKGTFYIDSEKDEIGWSIESGYKYSEIGKAISLGNLNVLTTSSGPYEIKIYRNFSSNLSVDGAQKKLQLESAPKPYKISVTNKGLSGGLVNIDISAF